MDNNTLLKIMSLYWQLFIIPNGIEDSLLPLVWPQTLLSRKKKKKKDKIQRMKTQEKSTRCPLTHALAKAVNLSQPGSLFFLPRWEGSQLLQLSTISCPMIPWAFFFFFPQNPECFIENMHTFFPTQQYKTVQLLL